MINYFTNLHYSSRLYTSSVSELMYSRQRVAQNTAEIG